MSVRALLIAVPAVLAATLAAPAWAVAAAGDNDTSYGSKGIAQIATGNAGRSSGAAAVLQDGRLLVAGQAAADTGAGVQNRMAITRLNADGSRDGAFGTGGETVLAAGTGESEALAVTLAPDGKIVAVGRAVDGATTKIAIARYLPNGQPDPSFDGDGVALLARGNGGNAAGQGVLVEANGSIVIAATVLDGGANKVSMARVTASGASDGSFTSLTSAGDGSDTRAAGLVRLGDGSFAVAGRTDDAGTQLFLARFSAANGQPTPGWGTTATGITTRFVGDGGSTIGNALAVSGNRVVVAGSAIDDNVGKTFVAAFAADSGQPDAAFGAGGATLAAVGSGGSSEASGVGFAVDGKIVTGGSATDDSSGATLSQFASVRLLPGGGLDPTFAPTAALPGAALVPANGLPAYGAALALQGDGKVLVAGRVGDGDGETLAATRICSADAQACVGPPGSAGGGGGSPAPGTPPRQPFECGKTVAFGLIAAEGCLREVGGRFEASGRVNVNGIIMQPEAQSTIILDPKALRLYVDGPGQSAGKLSARLGSITIFENLPLGSLSWSNTIDQLKLPGLAVSGRGSVFGFPISGKADLMLRKGGVELTVQVSLPKIFGGVTGEVVLRADLRDGFRPDGLRITAREAFLGPLRVKDVLIAYRDSDKLWTGQATVFLVPFPYGAMGAVAIQNGALKTVVAGVDGLNVPLGNTGVFLQRISFGIGVDPFSISGGIGFSAGPSVAGVSALRIDGNFRLSFPGSPAAKIELTTGVFCQVSSCPAGADQNGGEGLKVVNIPLGGFSFSADTDGQIAFAGQLGYDVGIASMNASVSGWLDGLKAFSVEGSGTACVFSIACAGAEGVISSEGLAACGYVQLLAVKVAVGFGIRWPADLSVMAGVCDIGPYRATRASAARLARSGPLGARQAQLPSPQTVTFPADKDYSLVRVTGDSAPPLVTLTGPDGATVATPEAPAPGAKTDRFMVFKDYAKKQTIFVVTKPGSQPWTVSQQPGSAAITAIDQADPLPEPSVQAKVGGSGYRRTLSWTAKAIPGQRIRFAEVGGGVTHVLAETRAARGSIRFAPRDGAKGTRKIVAQVLQDDLPRRNLTVAKYSAPARQLPTRLRTVTAVRGKSSLAIRFPSAGPAAATYSVIVKVSDGRVLLFTTTGKARKVSVPDFTVKDSAKVTVNGVTAGLRKGPATTVTVKLPAKKKKKAKAK